MAKASNLIQIGFNSRHADFLGDTWGQLAATGTNQAGAASVTTSLTQVTTATGGVNDGVVLPLNSSLKHSVFMIGNTSGATVKVYPGSGDAIMALSANSPLTLPTNCAVAFFKVSTTGWMAILGAAVT